LLENGAEERDAYGGQWKVLGSLKEGGESWVYRVIDTTGELIQQNLLQ